MDEVAVMWKLSHRSCKVYMHSSVCTLERGVCLADGVNAVSEFPGTMKGVTCVLRG